MLFAQDVLDLHARLRVIKSYGIIVSSSDQQIFRSVEVDGIDPSLVVLSATCKRDHNWCRLIRLFCKMTLLQEAKSDTLKTLLMPNVLNRSSVSCIARLVADL